MPGDEKVERRLTAVEVDMQHVARSLDALRRDVDAIQKDIREIRDFMAATKTGAMLFRLLWLAVAAAVGAIASKIWAVK